MQPKDGGADSEGGPIPDAVTAILGVASDLADPRWSAIDRLLFEFEAKRMGYCPVARNGAHRKVDIARPMAIDAAPHRNSDPCVKGPTADFRVLKIMDQFINDPVHAAAPWLSLLGRPRFPRAGASA